MVSRKVGHSNPAYEPRILRALLAGVVVARLPEASARRPGGRASLIPRVGVPVGLRADVYTIIPILVASWALGGLYLSLGPSAAAGMFGITSHLVGGLVATLLCGTGAVTAFALRTTAQGVSLITQPMTMAAHEAWVKNHYTPFHTRVKTLSSAFPAGDVYHLDLHSMPSRGTAMHNDPGGTRADVVISDFHGKSSRADFVELIKKAYGEAGFSISYNWPYFGGGITQMYGRPDEKHHTVQVELNRATYMDETTKKKSARFAETQEKLTKAVGGRSVLSSPRPAPLRLADSWP